MKRRESTEHNREQTEGGGQTARLRKKEGAMDWTLTESAIVALAMFGIPTVIGLLWMAFKSIFEFVCDYSRAVYRYFLWKKREKQRQKRWGHLK